MFLDRLESGLLLLQTPQGLVAVRPSFRQRVYLLWTFRNFRRLSVPLLTSRQAALIYELARNRANFVSQRYDPWLVIGTIENFLPPVAEETKVAIPPSAAAVEFSPAANIPASHTAIVDIPPIPQPESAKRESNPAMIELAMIQVATIQVTQFRALATWLGARWLWATTQASSKLAWFRSAASWVATAAATALLCIVSVVAWHRIQAIPDSEAHNQRQLQFHGEKTIAPPIPVSNEVSAAPSASPLAERPPGAEAQAAAEPTPAAPKPASVQETPDAGSQSVANESPTVSAAEAAVEKPVQIEQSAVKPVLIEPAPNIAAVNRSTERRLRVQAMAPLPKLPLTGDKAVQATRPPLHFVYPVYSGINARGVVTLTAGVDSGGIVRTVRIVSGNRALAAAAARAVRQWRYRPYLKDGQSVATETNIVISFFSDEAISMTFPRSMPVPR